MQAASLLALTEEATDRGACLDSETQIVASCVSALSFIRYAPFGSPSPVYEVVASLISILDDANNTESDATPLASQCCLLHPPP